MCRIIPQDEDWDTVCYDFEGDGTYYAFEYTPQYDDPGENTFTKGEASTKYKPATPDFIWTKVDCASKDLLEFDELVALDDHDDILEELNRFPFEYYEKYSFEGHIMSHDDVGRLVTNTSCDEVGCVCFAGYSYYFVPSRGASTANVRYSVNCK